VNEDTHTCDEIIYKTTIIPANLCTRMSAMSGEINYIVIVGDTICRKVDKIEDRIKAGFDSLHAKIDVGGSMLLSKVARLDALEAKVDAMQATLEYHTRVANLVVMFLLWISLVITFYDPHIVMAVKDRRTAPPLKFMVDAVIFMCDCVFLMPTDE
jgi:hypothetical protein